MRFANAVWEFKLDATVYPGYVALKFGRSRIVTNLTAAIVLLQFLDLFRLSFVSEGREDEC